MAFETNNSATPETDDVYRVMIVDDSAVIRGSIARAMEGEPTLLVAASVSNGDMAVKTLKRSPVDVVVLDIEMPIMDGLTALPLLKAVDPAVQVIMASTLTQKNAEVTLRAMSLGATDYVPKPTSVRETNNFDSFKRELVEKVKALGALARRAGVRLSPEAESGGPVGDRAFVQRQAGEAVAVRAPVRAFAPPPKAEVVLRKDPILRPNIIAIGSSTGGPQALFKVIKEIGNGLPQPVVITQHMPPSFTTILAEHITKQCGVDCVEAIDGQPVVGGRYFLAPGDFHMLLDTKNGQTVVKLTKDAPENFCRPSVDPMLRSLVPIYGRNILTVILTGMGADGTKGGTVVVKAGGAVVAQDEATSVVWGMPGAAAAAGICSALLPVDEIGAYVRRIALRTGL
jgi:two-component system chemotaxis response regulator CheB